METEKTEIIIADKFYSFINLKEDFKRKYNDLSNKGYLLSQLENDVDFMSAFQDDFRKTDMEPDVNKYWRLIYTKEQLDACISNLHNFETTILHFPLESELIARKIEFYNKIKEGKEPKDCYTHKIEETNIYKQFRAIEDIYNRFKEMKGFDSSADSLRQQAEEFGKGLISEIQNINYEPIKTKVIETIVSDKDNIHSYIKSRSNINKFNKIEFEDNYAKAKMYLDNYLKKYLETEEITKKANNQSNTIEKKPTKKENHLFAIGLKLALGELDEDLIIKEDKISLKTNLSIPKLANKHELDELYLKCTISNYTKTNQTKNLRNNPEIIKKVITHLESTDKEPKEWFLKEFKI